jgi:hypothetical protein
MTAPELGTFCRCLTYAVKQYQSPPTALVGRNQPDADCHGCLIRALNPSTVRFGLTALGEETPDKQMPGSRLARAIGKEASVDWTVHACWDSVCVWMLSSPVVVVGGEAEPLGTVGSLRQKSWHSSPCFLSWSLREYLL